VIEIFPKLWLSSSNQNFYGAWLGWFGGVGLGGIILAKCACRSIFAIQIKALPILERS